jgi:hypothetical protein
MKSAAGRVTLPIEAVNLLELWLVVPTCAHTQVELFTSSMHLHCPPEIYDDTLSAA